ncbi:M48 family metallopeptidase, partial [Thermodesulfobacteriota bacterium]
MIPLNSFLLAYIGIYLASSAVDLLIERINAKHLAKYGEKVPDAFEGTINLEELKKIHSYATDNIRFKMFQTCIAKLIFLFIILSGMLPWLSEFLKDLSLLVAGLIFFAVPGLLLTLTGIPFDYYHSFIIEGRYGFNTKTIKIWLSDLIKSMFILTIIGAFLISALLLMIRYTGPAWWVWIWAVFIGFQLILTVIYPIVIAPLFNKFIPLEESDLKRSIEKLASGEGFNVQGIYQMDATKRTRHTNAYFTGIGKSKRIVLFDSLIQSHGNDEIKAILS